MVPMTTCLSFSTVLKLFYAVAVEGTGDKRMRAHVTICMAGELAMMEMSKHGVNGLNEQGETVLPV